MSSEHKKAMAVGREEGVAVRRYLDAVSSTRAKRGRKRTPESIDRKLASVEEKLQSADSLSRLHLIQERKDLQIERERLAKVTDLSALEEDFVKVAKSYGARKGISYSTWRDAGVSSGVLQRAGIPRGRD